MDVATLLKRKGAAVVTVRPTATVMTVAHMMRFRNIGAVVVSSDDEHILGLISERDIARGLATHGEETLDLRVTDLMLRSVHTCTPNQNIRRVMADMTDLRIRHLPVTEDHRLCGMVSIGDVVKSLLEDMEMEISVLRDAQIASH